ALPALEGPARRGKGSPRRVIASRAGGPAARSPRGAAAGAFSQTDNQPIVASTCVLRLPTGNRFDGEIV
ncbi:MAG: hypothetical protein ACO3YN_17900, partial [Rubrivivax sp.]